MPHELDIDHTGSLIRRSPITWLIAFVPPIKPQFWHPLLGSWMKHCFAMHQGSDGKWVLFEPWWSRIQITALSDVEAGHFLTWARRGAALSVKEQIPGRSSQMRVWMSCAALISHLLGRPYQVWTPYQLYKKLVKEPEVRHITDAELLSLGAWQEANHDRHRIRRRHSSRIFNSWRRKAQALRSKRRS